jgi:hypothetical protein
LWKKSIKAACVWRKGWLWDKNVSVLLAHAGFQLHFAKFAKLPCCYPLPPNAPLNRQSMSQHLGIIVVLKDVSQSFVEWYEVVSVRGVTRGNHFHLFSAIVSLRRDQTSWWLSLLWRIDHHSSCLWNSTGLTLTAYVTSCLEFMMLHQNTSTQLCPLGLHR